MEEIMRQTIVTDWHTHILPGIDDGSRDTDESLAMLRSSALQGVSAVVLTPHFYPQNESPGRFLERRNDAWIRLEQAIAKQSGEGVDLPVRILGAEVYYFDELGGLDAEELSALCIGDTRILMVEMPSDTWSHRVFDCLEKLIFQRNVRPLIAHIDRYYKAVKDTESLDALIGEGLLVQLNTGALNGLMPRRKAFQWMRAGRVHRIGSDCHNMKDRKPELSEALALVRKQFGEDALAMYFAGAESK